MYTHTPTPFTADLWEGPVCDREGHPARALPLSRRGGAVRAYRQGALSRAATH